MNKAIDIMLKCRDKIEEIAEQSDNDELRRLKLELDAAIKKLFDNSTS